MTKKGRTGEYEAYYSLQAVYPEIQPIFLSKPNDIYDLETEGIFFEVKKHKGFSWNKLAKTWDKLRGRTPADKRAYLIFKANQQPACVMFSVSDRLVVQTFEDFFNTRWIQYKDCPKIQR